MKLFIILVVMLFFFLSACKPCYECPGLSNWDGQSSDKVCSGDSKYKQARKWGQLTNDQGQEVSCY